MPLYERRTYQVRIGQMPELTALYREKAWPVVEAAGLAKHCVGYFITDTGALHQLVHIWRFEDDAERRNFWEKLLGIDAFPLVEIRSLLVSQENQLLRGADWGPVA